MQLNRSTDYAIQMLVYLAKRSCPDWSYFAMSSNSSILYLKTKWSILKLFRVVRTIGIMIRFNHAKSRFAIFLRMGLAETNQSGGI